MLNIYFLSIYSRIYLLIRFHLTILVDKIWRRHDILSKTIGTLEKENYSAEMATHLFKFTLSIFLLFKCGSLLLGGGNDFCGQALSHAFLVSFSRKINQPFHRHAHLPAVTNGGWNLECRTTHTPAANFNCRSNIVQSLFE